MFADQNGSVPKLSVRSPTEGAEVVQLGRVHRCSSQAGGIVIAKVTTKTTIHEPVKTGHRNTDAIRISITITCSRKI